MYFIVNCSSQHRWPEVSTITHGENELSLFEGKNSFSTMKTDGAHAPGPHSLRCDTVQLRMCLGTQYGD